MTIKKAVTLPAPFFSGSLSKGDARALLRSLFIGLLLFGTSWSAFAQYSTGKIIYERRTNLYKKYKKEDDITRWIPEDKKIKIDAFELYFNDSISAFKPQETEATDNYSWTTTQNTVYQDYKNHSSLTIRYIWEEKFYVKDTLLKRKWKITDSKRNIAGYSCRKAVWQANDSTRIYAWFTDALMASTGPESFCGLPGVILGLATEDGGIIYFAKSVELITPDTKTLQPPKIKDKIYTIAELKGKLDKEFGKKDWYKEEVGRIFGIW